MARPPLADEALVDRFGPHRNDAPARRLAVARADRPAGRRRTAASAASSAASSSTSPTTRSWASSPATTSRSTRASSAPRASSATCRTTTPTGCSTRSCAPTPGSRATSWDDALDRTVGELRRIQAAHGPDAVAVFGGASLTTEKAYLLGKLARLGLGTRHIDYNGRLCMVSAGVGYKKAFGVDRAPNPWSDIPQADVVFVIGANIAECAPITTATSGGPATGAPGLIVADPRITPIARTADLFLGLRPGHRLGAAVRHAAPRHRARPGRPRLRGRPHRGLRGGGRGGEPQTPAWAAAITGVPAARIETAAEAVGRACHGHAPARPRAGAPVEGRGERVRSHQPGAGQRAHRPAGVRS